MGRVCPILPGVKRAGKTKQKQQKMKTEAKKNDGFGPGAVKVGLKETTTVENCGVRSDVVGLEAPFNWDPKLIGFCGAINKARDCLYPIRVLYGADRYSTTGNGRGPDVQAARGKPYEDYFRRCHDLGIEFHYLWNALFLDNLEWDTAFRDRLRREADELVAAGVDCVVVANPALQLFLKAWHPELRVGTSVNSHLDSVERVGQLIRHTGIDTIMLDHRNSRNFGLIRDLRREFPSYPIIVLSNESCLLHCTLQCAHQAALGAASRCGGSAFHPNLCDILCAREKLLNPLHVLRAPWIRPEDIHHLFEAGATLVKLAGRTEPTEWIVELLKAYSTARCEGDVFRFIEKSGLRSPAWERMIHRPLTPARFQLNNSALEGFITPFVEGRVPCVKNQAGCGSCGWCASFMHAITCPENHEQRLQDVGELLAICMAGDFGKESEVLQAA